MAADTATLLSNSSLGQRPEQPVYYKDTFVADDTDNHDFRLDTKGKSASLIFVDNPSDQSVTISIYGCPDETAEIGDSDVKQIGSDLAVGTTSNGIISISEPWPFLLIRAKFAVTGDSTTVVIFYNSHSGGGSGPITAFLGLKDSNNIVGQDSNSDGQNLSNISRLGVGAVIKLIAPDDKFDRGRSLGDTAGAGLGVLAAAPWIPGASDVKSTRVNQTSTATRQTVLTPTSGKKIRIISVILSFDNAVATAQEVYFDTGANLGSDSTKAIVDQLMDTDINPGFLVVYPDGGGPVGEVDDVLSFRQGAANGASKITIHYREE